MHLLGIRNGDSAGSSPPDPYPITSQIFLPDGTTPVARENRPLAQALSDQDSHNVELTIVRPDGAARVTVTRKLASLDRHGRRAARRVGESCKT